MINKILFIFICFSLFLNEAGRIDLGNNIAFTLLDVSVIIFLSYNLIAFLIKKEKFSREQFTKPFLIFVAILFFSLLLNFVHYSVTQLLVAFLYLIRFIIYCLTYLAIKKLFKTQKKFVMISLCITFFFILLSDFIQYFFYTNLRNLYYLGWDEHIYRLFGSFFDPNFAAAFLALGFLFFVTLWLETKKKKLNVLSYLFLLLSGVDILALFLTFSRSGLIMLFVSSLIYFGLIKKLRYFSAVIASLVIIYFVVSPNSAIVNTNLLRIVSSEARIDSAQVALAIIEKNPIIGVGFDAYRYAQLRYSYRTVVGTQESHADAGTDNSFLFVWATSGIIGLGAFLWLNYTILCQLWNEFTRKNQLFSALVLASLVGLYVDSIFINSLFYPSLLLWTMLILGIRDYK
ncbi:MAG TPA: O-antigen ligase family protein [Patescibacteria group bacterium]|nr:O-antigen ligase family protein [Patescibacteria group bacterium]